MLFQMKNAMITIRLLMTAVMKEELLQAGIVKTNLQFVLNAETEFEMYQRNVTMATLPNLAAQEIVRLNKTTFVREKLQMFAIDVETESLILLRHVMTEKMTEEGALLIVKVSLEDGLVLEIQVLPVM